MFGRREVEDRGGGGGDTRLVGEGSVCGEGMGGGGMGEGKGKWHLENCGE